MKYGNNELRERWKAIKRQAWNDDEFNEQVEKFEKYAVEEFQRVQKNANIKLRILEEKYKQDREEIMKGLYADEIEINDSCIEIIDEIYNEIPKESRVKNTTSMRQLLLRIWAEQANCLYGSGNILGYRRENGTYVPDPDQAETVRLIFQMYSDGEKGLTQIVNELYRLGRLDAGGHVSWDASKVSRVLHNATYKGCICYNKSHSDGYLTQKRIKKSG